MKLQLGVLLALSIARAGGTCRRPNNNQQPVIGIIAQACDDDACGAGYPEGATQIAASYVKFVEMTGGRAVPVFDREDDQYLQFLFDHLNGVLIPGGYVSLTSSPYAYASSFFYNKSIELFDSTGELFPILGICLGFEELMTLANGGQSPMSSVDAENVLLPLDLTPFARDGSWTFAKAPQWIMEILASKNVTANFHHHGLLTSTFETNENIQRVFNLLSTNVDTQGRNFVSAAEGVRYPFMALQFHPEKNIFEWNPLKNLAHDFEGVAVSTYFANTFIELARQSCHRFESQAVFNKLVIWNYDPVFTKSTDMDFTQTYIFRNDY